MKKIDLNGAYRLYAYDYELAPRHPSEVEGEHIAASVPGNIELDYMTAGKLSDVFHSENGKAAQQLEWKDFWYIREFELPEKPENELWLHFEGVDTIAEYFLNGVKIGGSDNMLIEHSFDVTEAIRQGENTLAVHIHSSMANAKQFEIRPYNVAFPGCYESLHIRKSAMNYGWDISPRLLSAGIWKDVWLEVRDEARFKDVYLTTASVYENVAVLVLSVNADIPDVYMGKCKLAVNGQCGENAFAAEYPMPFNSTTVYPYVKDAALWWPNGMGEQNLYDIQLQITYEDAVVAKYQLHYGIRKAELKFGDAVGDEGNFALYINNKLCRCRGANWVPVSLLHSQDKVGYEEAVRNFKDANCNTVRVWGGGVYEQEEFFNLCDEYGIMVWQDMMLACHGYPMTDQFYKAMQIECEAVAKRIRNHPSLVLYCGGNETDWPYVCVGLDPNDDKISRGAIKDTLYQFDPYRSYLPSTPYFSREFIKKNGGRFYLDLQEIKRERTSLPQEHYWWHREDFLEVREQNHKFISEIGYSGPSDRNEIDRYLPNGWTFDDDSAWEDHSYPTEGSRQCGMNYLFTDIPGNDDDKILASQFYQAEAYKYVVELCRMRNYQNGILLWTMRENWPSFSSAMVDYYGKRKKSFYAVKNANEPVQCMIDICADHATAYLINDRLDGKAYTVTISDERGNVLYSGEVQTSADTPVTKIGSLQLEREKVLLTRVTDGDKEIRNYRYVYTEKISYIDYQELYEMVFGNL